MAMLVPDFPFPYAEHLAAPAGLGELPPHAQGTEVAVIGAGMAGLVTAYELMRLGLRPVLHEAGEIGGRLRTATFPQVDRSTGAVADLGGMRFPASGRAFGHYLDLLDVATAPFPNPLAPQTPSTVIELGGRAVYAERPEDLPPVFAEVSHHWATALAEGADLPALRVAVAARATRQIKQIWNRLVPRLDEESFYGFVARSPAFGDFSHRELFGQVGFGTGGWDTDFPNSMLEILRVVATDADDQHVRILGGAQQVPLALWRHTPETLTGHPVGTSLESLHDGAPRPAVRALRRLDDGRLGVLDRWGTERAYPAVVSTVQSWLLSAGIDTDESLFSHDLWMALERSHYMQSSKTFVLVDRPFWRDRDPVTGRHVMSTTLTDRLTRGTYLLDGGRGLDDPAAAHTPAVVCLSYTWNDDALKWLALPTDERVRLMLHSMSKIYPDLDLAAHIRGEPVTISWENEPHFMGAFRGNLPGHYRYQRRLFTHFVQDAFPAEHRGVFLAGDDISFTPGWAEGAVQTAINAVWGVVRHLGGTCAPTNPGPGDRFGELAPIRLP
ncbi:NAD(P)/FAD-dependent oxidoreductase [Actinomycetospora sp. NBRC 106375]|uniref:flavin monoamine oxidase family protein n=1 Tax=Actinomycetospora sp. NBRC 106375 TaxID=3032207 RepID=UPI002555D931|nr:NAD(P)/FAD-dependent oxidoreductase [Actinomycetospora sp. NBRC 106375]